jgi:hypothetical protein
MMSQPLQYDHPAPVNVSAVQSCPTTTCCRRPRCWTCCAETSGAPLWSTVVPTAPTAHSPSSPSVSTCYWRADTWATGRHEASTCSTPCCMLLPQRLSRGGFESSRLIGVGSWRPGSLVCCSLCILSTRRPSQESLVNATSLLHYKPYFQLQLSIYPYYYLTRSYITWATYSVVKQISMKMLDCRMARRKLKAVQICVARWFPWSLH